jgi:glycosyltransferase involved in cell wall biosynthesis
VAFAQVDKLLCQSTAQLERVRALGADAVLLTNGVDIEFHVPPVQADDKPRTILAVGRLGEAQKRFSDLLRAMQRLPDFHLTIVGSGPDGAMLRARARDLGVTPQVTFAGFVSDKRQLRAMYQSCGVFVSTSAWEAMALVMLEAMSCGAAVVGTRIGTFEDLLTDGVDGRLVPVGAPPDELARVIRDAYDRRTSLGENARRTVVERYSSDVTYRRLSQLIEAA